MQRNEDKQVGAGGEGVKNLKFLFNTLFFDFEGFPFSKLLNVEVVYSLV